MQKNEQNQPAMYLGDSVYAKFDGYMIGLTLDRHMNPVLIWMEPQVIENLERFIKAIKDQQTEQACENYYANGGTPMEEEMGG